MSRGIITSEYACDQLVCGSAGVCELNIYTLFVLPANHPDVLRQQSIASGGLPASHDLLPHSGYVSASQRLCR